MPTLSLTAKIKALSGFTVSFVGTRKKNYLELPLLKGQPYIPSSSIRGRLRHTATHMVIAGRVKHDLPKLRLADVNWLAIGGIKQGKNVAGAAGLDMMVHRPFCARHPWSFWGFGDPMFMASKLQIEHAEPVSPVRPDTIHGQRTDPVQRFEFDAEQVADPASFDEYFQRVGQRKAAVDRNKAIDRNKAVVARNKTAANGASAEKEAVDQPAEKEAVDQPANMPFTREIIPSGVEFTSVFDINHATDLEVGMFVATLRVFAEHPVFGAQAAMNLGLVDLSLSSSAGEIMIDGRARSFEASPVFYDLENRFWEAFPTLDFAVPVLGARENGKAAEVIESVPAVVASAVARPRGRPRRSV